MDEDLEILDPQRRAFLFSLNMREKFEQTSDFSIVRSNNKGPIFGSRLKNDLQLLSK